MSIPIRLPQVRSLVSATRRVPLDLPNEECGRLCAEYYSEDAAGTRSICPGTPPRAFSFPLGYNPHQCGRTAGGSGSSRPRSKAGVPRILPAFFLPVMAHRPRRSASPGCSGWRAGRDRRRTPPGSCSPPLAGAPSTPGRAWTSSRCSRECSPSRPEVG